jgi:hypothetical protein
MQPTVAFQGQPITLGAALTAAEIFARGSEDDRQVSAEVVRPFRGINPLDMTFRPWLIKLGERRTGAGAREALPRLFAGHSLRVGTSVHLAAFSRMHPDYPGAAHSDPIMAIGDPVKVEEFDRILAIYWGPQDRRRIHTFFDCASFGPLVSFLRIEELPFDY